MNIPKIRNMIALALAAVLVAPPAFAAYQGNVLPASKGGTGVTTGLSVLNGSNITSGTIPDARHSSNIPLKNGANTYTAAQTIGSSGTPVDLSVPGAGTNAQHYGPSSTATGTGDVAVGHTAAAAGGASTAVGYQSSATGAASTVLGKGATATGASATAIGTSANANNAVTCVAVGVSTVIGTGANYGVAVGGGANAGHIKAIALGYQATTTEANSMEVGASGDKVRLITYGGRVIGLRVATSTPVTVATSDEVIACKLSVAGAVAVNLPASPRTGMLLTVKDATGDAAANNITITPAAGNIDGAGTLVIAANYGRAVLVYNGTEWNVIT